MQICQPILAEFEKRLQALFSNKNSKLHSASKHILLGSGKRIRPLMVLLSTLDLNGSIEKAYVGAVALELIHTYSLIHDDLPCMDNDDLRRGKLTVHKAFDEAIAVLAGDFLLTEAFSSLINSKQLDDSTKVKALKLLSKYSSDQYLIGGQIIDMEMENQVGHLQDLQDIYIKKTASLFCCGFEFAALFSNQPEDVCSKLKLAAEKIGIAFQIKNDFKGIEKDKESNKFTIFSLCSIKQAKQVLKMHILDAFAILDQTKIDFSHTKNLFKEVFINDEV